MNDQSAAFAPGTLRTNDISQAPPELDYSDTSPLRSTGPRTPILADLPRNISSQLALWSTNCDSIDDFQAREAMRYTMIGDGTRWSTQQMQMSANTPSAESGHTATSTKSPQRSPSVVPDVASAILSGFEASPDDAVRTCFGPRSLYSSAASSRSYQPRALSTSSIQPPSLVMSGITATSTGGTIRNGFPLPLVKQLPDLEEDQEMSYLDDIDEVVGNESLEYPCAFWYLDCASSSTSVIEWKTHCLSHFRGNSPPKSASCPLCPFTIKGADAWDRCMNHVAEAHHARGESLELSKPDSAMFKWLWKKRLISNALFKELESDFEGRSGQLLSMDTEGRATEERREAPVMRRLM